MLKRGPNVRSSGSCVVGHQAGYEEVPASQRRAWQSQGIPPAGRDALEEPITA